jgi:IPT/TIG domain
VSSTSPASNLIAALLPSNTALASISGGLVDGQLLSAATGSWSGTGPIGYGYQWQLCNASGASCSNISGSVGSTLSLVSGEVGSTLRVVVTATNAAGSVSSTSPATGLIAALLPSNTGLPSVSGTPKDGQVLSASTGSWSGTTPISYGYQWQLCNASGGACSNISGPVGSALSIVSGYVGSTLRVVVTATNAAGSVSSTSTATGLIAALLPSNTALPSISGVLQTGKLLTAATGSWTGTPTITYGYQWQLCNVLGTSCNNIAKATSSTFLPGLLDVGLTLRVVVTATNAAGSTPATSNVTGLIEGLVLAPVAGPPSGGTAVVLSGAGVGEATSIHFGSAPASEIEVKSPSEVVAVSPPGSGTVGVTVTVPEGTTPTTPSDQFTYR